MTKMLLAAPLLLAACAQAQPNTSPPSLSLVPADYYHYYRPRVPHGQAQAEQPAPRADEVGRIEGATRKVYDLQYQLAAPPR